jgi:putative ABC transport system permease protein
MDFKQAFRSLAKNPGFTAVVLLTLGLGIGGSTSIFSVVYGVLLRPLPYADPDRIVAVKSSPPNRPDDSGHSPADFLDLQRENSAFAVLAGYRQDIVDITASGTEPLRLDGALVTNAFFDVFGVPAALGRTFTAADAPNGDRLVVISDGTWRQHFGGDRNVIGRVVRVNGTPHTITGVMPSQFDYPGRREAWVMSDMPVPPCPVEVEGNLLERRDIQYFQVVARLRPDVTDAHVTSDLAAMSRRIGERTTRGEGRIYSMASVRDDLVGDVKQSLVLLLGAVGCVLLIACANVAGLLVARGVGRQREVGIRTALGAPRGRIVRQLLAESVMLSVIGGAVGLLLATWGTDALVALVPSNIPRLHEVRMDARVALFAAIVSAATGVLSGLAPALHTSKVNVIELLRDGGRTAGGQRSRRVRSALVTGEVALALVLLVAAGLLINSFVRLRSVDPGFQMDRVVSAFVVLPGSVYSSASRQAGFYHDLLERLASSPMTRSSAITFPAPFSNSSGNAGYELEGTAPNTSQDRPSAALSIASSKTFAALGIPVVAGRTFTDADVEDAPPVVIVNQALARKHWPGENPVGKRITFDTRSETPKPTWSTVIGVVGDTRPRALDQGPKPTVYFSYQQFSLPYMAVVVRGTDDAAAIARELRTHVRAIDPNLPLDEVQTLEQAASKSAAQPRFRTYVLGGFAAISLLLTATALYGLLSYSVTQRVREIGVRMALGAQPRDVLGLVVREGMTLVAVGSAVGIVAALAAGRVVSSLLFGVTASDPVTYVVVILVLATVAFVASYLPALRAARVNPMSALRSE